MKVLVVDDSMTMRAIERGILEQLGLTDIVEAVDGEDALAKLPEFEPDLVLVDWSMPRMDGLAFVRRFRELHAQTPVIMVTAETDRERVVEAIKAGVSHYVVKPFTPDVLSQRIEETLARPVA